jgi:hypothetical protein
MALILSFSTEVDAPLPNPTDCDEIGRVTRCIVSAHDRTRTHEARIGFGEKRCLVADFSGAISPSRYITSITWRCIDGYVIAMSNARIQGTKRSAAVDIQANYGGESWLRCDVTLDNGEIYVQRFHASVVGYPWPWPDPVAPGPLILTAS